MYDLNTPKEVFEALGGTAAAGKALRKSDSSIYNTSMQSVFPGNWHLIVFAAVKRIGKTVNPRLFNLNAKDLEPLQAAQDDDGKPARRAPKAARKLMKAAVKPKAAKKKAA